MIFFMIFNIFASETVSSIRGSDDFQIIQKNGIFRIDKKDKKKTDKKMDLSKIIFRLLGA